MVRLEAGSRLDGKTKGNSAKPAVQMLPTIIRLVPTKLPPPLLRLEPSSASNAPRMPAAGAIKVTG